MINPYQPPVTPTASGTSEVLRFDGTISEQDYIEMLPGRAAMKWLRGLLVILIAPMVLMFAVGMVATVSAKGFALPTYAVLGILLIITVSCAALVYLSSPTLRGRWHLRSKRDLLATVRGQFSSDGLLLHNNGCDQWYSPQFCRQMQVTKHGIRWPLDENPYHFIAFSKRLFSTYSFAAAKEMASAWATFDTGEESESDWMVHPFDRFPGTGWKVNESGATDVVTFGGCVSMRLPMQSEKLLKQLRGNEWMTVFWTLAAVGAWAGGHYWFSLLVALSAVMTAFGTVKLWKSYHHGDELHTWRQVGWTDGELLVWRNETMGFRGQWVDRLDVNEPKDCLVVTTPNDGRCYIPKDQVATEEDWNQLNRWLAVHDSSEQGT